MIARVVWGTVLATCMSTAAPAPAEEAPAFAAKPTATATKDGVKVEFAVNKATDVAVEIVSDTGAVVRHLASGVLGPNAPEPFQKNSRRQTIIWDGKDDQAVYVEDKDRVTVRVSLGLQARFERQFLWGPHLRSQGGTPPFCAQPEGAGGHMDGVHAFGPGSIGWALVKHYRLTGDTEWFRKAAPRIKANAEWMLRQRRVVKDMVPGGERLWCKGLQPALQVTPDSGGLWMQFYECEAYYWVFVSHFAEALATIDPAEGARLKAEAEAYRKDLLAAVERSIALSPVVPVRDGTYHSVIPFACYARGLATGAWGWKRDGSGEHVGPLYWETVQSAAALISPAGLLPANDVRVQGYFDVLEDRLLLENRNVGGRDWFLAGWQYQGGLERTSNMHLAADDVPVFIRSLLNCHAVDILPGSGYVFNEHAVHGPPDKIFEEAAFLERFRNLLVMEEGDTLWLACATPRVWLTQGQKISVKNAPTHFGVLAYEIVSDVDHGRITATIQIPSGVAPESVLLRLRHPRGAAIKTVTVNAKDSRDFNPAKETVRLRNLTGTAVVQANYK